jgi:hypothetical protein
MMAPSAVGHYESGVIEHAGLHDPVHGQLGPEGGLLLLAAPDRRSNAEASLISWPLLASGQGARIKQFDVACA